MRSWGWERRSTETEAAFEGIHIPAQGKCSHSHSGRIVCIVYATTSSFDCFSNNRLPKSANANLKSQVNQRPTSSPQGSSALSSPSTLSPFSPSYLPISLSHHHQYHQYHHHHHPGPLVTRLKKGTDQDHVPSLSEKGV